MAARLLACLVAVALSAACGVASAADRGDLDGVRRATAAYHDVTKAEEDGYAAFLDCFDSDAGGMGQHYVDQAALDGVVDADHPESLVYEVKRGRLHLVAVEYIVPDSPQVAAHPPRLFGQQFHLNAELGVWVLHAWVWRANPAGMFADYNPNVAGCVTP